MPDNFSDLVRNPHIDRQVERALNEIIQSEKKYVKTLSTIVEKLVKPAAKRTELFSPADVATLFGNIVELNQMHRAFYEDLAMCGSGDVQGLMRVIEIHIPSMSIAYSRYCSNFPHATAFYNRLVKTSQRPTRMRRGIGSINSINLGNFYWDNDDDLGGYRRLKEEGSGSSNGSSPYATICRRHSIYSGDSSSSSSSDDSGINEAPKRFSHYFTKRRVNSRKESKADPCPFYPRAFNRLTFLNLSLAGSGLDDGLPILAYLLEPVQRVMRYSLLLKNLKDIVTRCPMRHNLLGSIDHTLDITEQLAMITNLTQPFMPVDSEPTEPEPTTQKTATSEKKRRRFEFMRQAAQRLKLRAR